MITVRKRGVIEVKKTKIICSIGPSSCEPDVMEQLVKNGMNVARINFSHATKEEKEGVVAAVKEVRKRTGKNVAILYDTKGPEFRTGMMQEGGVKLEEGKLIRIVKDDIIGTEEAFTVNYPLALNSINVDDTVLLENGLMELKVVSKEEDGVTCHIMNGGVLGNKKSMNVPGVLLDMPFISDTDREDIIYACQHEADFLALSFVSSKEDVLEAREILKRENREDLKIISKIESAKGIENLDEIISVSDGIMVARGDLGVEIPMEELPAYQSIMIKKCREREKFCIVATEMLASMYTSSRPTRAEVSDIYNAVLNGTDAVMLSGETTIGKYPVEAVSYMANICESAEAHYDYDKRFNFKEEVDVTETIAAAVVKASEVLDCKLVVVATMSGKTAKKISNLKPKAITLTLCTSEEVARSLALNWGVYPIVVPVYDSTDQLVKASLEKAKEFIHLEHGDKVIITGGFLTGAGTSTNFMKIEEL